MSGMPSRPLISELRPAGRAVSVVVAVAAALLAGGAGVAAAAPAAAPTLVVVTVGAPAEQSFRLTPAKGIPAGRVTFRVTNAGRVPHSFKLCSARLAVTPSAGAPTSCAGTATPTLAPGRSASLTVTLTPGRWAFLSAVAGQAARGLRGVLTVVAARKLPAAAPAVTATAAATAPAPVPAPTPAPAPAAEALLGDPAAGLVVFRVSGCAGCHTLAAAGAIGSDGPNLDGRKPGQARISAAVSGGAYGGSGIVMPAFTLSPTDLANIAAFVYSATHS